MPAHSNASTPLWLARPAPAGESERAREHEQAGGGLGDHHEARGFGQAIHAFKAGLDEIEVPPQPAPRELAAKVQTRIDPAP